MGHETSQSYYLKQFLRGQNDAETADENGRVGNYRESFMSAAQNTSEPKDSAAVEPEVESKVELKAELKADPEVDSSSKVEDTQPVKNDLFNWETNVGRFPEEELPFLSKKSIKQLESNFRELMIVEANINTLAKSGNTIYVSSCTNKCGKTISAISTAFGLSFYSGKNVLLLDGNHENAQVHNLFGINESPGFYDLCNGSATLEQVVMPTKHKGLSILTIGAAGLPAASQDRVAEVLKTLSVHFDYVVCDGGSVMTSSLTLRDVVNYSIAFLVIECEKTRWELLQIAEDKIKKSGGPTAIGIVFNRRKYYIPRFVYKFIS